MEQNPIKYSDLISPDDSIEKLVNQLTLLNETYTGMASNVRQQAASVAESLKNISGATEAGRKSTKAANDDAERLERAYKQLDAALSDNAKEIARLNEIKREANNYNKNMVKLGGEEIKTREQIAQATYNQLSAQYSLNKAYINSLSATDREIKENKELIETTKAIYEQMKNLQEATGKYTLNVGNYENAITSAIGVNSKWFGELKNIAALFEGGFSNGVKAAGEAVAGLGKRLLALLANPIVLTIAGITAAFAALAKGISSSEENTNALARVMAPFERILTGVVNVLQTMAGWLLKGVEGMEQLAMGASRLMEKLPLVGSAFKKVNDSLQENIELTRRKQELDKNTRLMNERIAQSELNVAKFRSDAAKTDDPARRAQLNKMAIREEEKIMQERLKLAKEDYEIKKARAAQSQNDKQTNDELSASYVTLLRVQKEYYDRTLRMQKQVTTNEAKLNKDGGSGSSGKEKAKQQEADGKKSLELQRKLEDARIALIEDVNVRERMTILATYNRQIEDLQTKLDTEKTITVSERQSMNDLIIALEQQKQQKLADLFEKSAKQQAEQEKKRQEAEQKQRQDALKASERAINQQYDVEMSYAELEQAENKKTEMRLKAEKKRLQALLDLYEKDGKTLTAAEVQTIKNSITAVDNELAKNKKGRDMYDMLGFNLNDDQKEAINEAFSFAMDNLNSYIDAWVQAADKKREAADKDVESTKNALDAEIEARNKGYASSVETARKEYEQAKKNQEKAIREQEKAQKAQEAVQTMQQIGNLVTATSMIWSQLGFPWAIPAIAVMWGSFAAAKIKAVQVAQSGTEQYGEGTVELLQGGSHQSGNDIDLGRKQDGTRRRAEGGEFFAVINKRNSRRYRKIIPEVIGALNNGTFAQKYMRAYDDGGVSVSVNGTSPDLSKLTDDVRLIREQGERTRTYDANGNEITSYKNLRRIIRR